MNKNDLDFFIHNMPENSVKRACYVACEYLRCKKADFSSPAVSEEEFYSALGILLAHSYQTSDNETTVEQWYCEGDCNRNNGSYGFCPGEFQTDKKAKTLCKYYSDPENI